MSKVWLLAGVAMVGIQLLSLLQVTRLRDRIVQMEAGAEFWEYGQSQCTAPAGSGQGQPARGGLAAYLPTDAV